MPSLIELQRMRSELMTMLVNFREYRRALVNDIDNWNAVSRDIEYIILLLHHCERLIEEYN